MWRGVLGAKVGLGVVFTVLFFVVMYVNLWIADRIAPAFRPLGPEEEIVERYHEVVGARAGLVRLAIAGLFALIAGPGAASHWNEWILFRNHVPFNVDDAQFGRDIGFFVFQLPFWRFVVGWVFAAIVIILVVTAVAHYLNGGIRVQTPGQKVTPQVKAHLSVLLGVLALLKAAGYYLQQFELDFSTRGVVQGATYTDVKAQLPALKLLIGISIFAFVPVPREHLHPGLDPAGARGRAVGPHVGRRRRRVPGLHPEVPREPRGVDEGAPYIKRNIEATRAAMNIDVHEKDVKNFAYDDKNLNAQSLVENPRPSATCACGTPRSCSSPTSGCRASARSTSSTTPTSTATSSTASKTQVLISARELNTAGVTSSSWVNRHLQFTHGYGAVARRRPTRSRPRATRSSIVKDLPPHQATSRSTSPGSTTARTSTGYAIVKTEQREVDFPQANGTQPDEHLHGHRRRRRWTRSSSGPRSRCASATTTRFISGFVTDESRALYVRDIRAPGAQGGAVPQATTATRTRS